MANLASAGTSLTKTIYTFYCPLCRRFYEDEIDDEELKELQDMTRICPDCQDEPIIHVLPVVHCSART